MLNINSILPQIKLLEAMIEDGYEDKRTIQRRVDKFKEWLKEPELLSADEDVEYAAVIEIDLNKITEPIVACPNNPDDVATISEVLASDRPSNIDEVFVGSCMTNIGHYRALGEVLKGEGQVPVMCTTYKNGRKTAYSRWVLLTIWSSWCKNRDSRVFTLYG